MKKLVIFGMFIGMMVAKPVDALFGKETIEKIKTRLNLPIEDSGDPYIENIEPASGAPCITATINGRNLKGIGWVKFGWKTAQIIDSNDNKIIVEAPYPPSGEKRTVEVTVGFLVTSNSVLFTYEEPIIDSIFPSSGKVGTEVTIKGRYFGVKGPHPSFYVKFGKSLAKVNSWADKEIIAEAPSDYGTGINDKKMMLNLITYAYYGWSGLVDEAIKKLLNDLLLSGVKIPPSEGKIEVDVGVTTPVGKSNTKVFTYQLSDETLPAPSPIFSEHPWPMIRYDSQHSGRSSYFGPERPELKWKIKSFNCNWVAVAKDETIYGEFSAEFGGATKAFGVSADGSLKMGSPVGYGPMGIAGTGVIYILGRWDAKFWGIDPKGKIILEKEIDISPNLGSLVIGNDGTIYFVIGSRKSAFLYCFSEKGSFNWKLPFTPAEFGDPLPAIDRRDGTIYIISREKKSSCFLNALTPDGRLKWRYEISVDNMVDWEIAAKLERGYINKSDLVRERNSLRTIFEKSENPIFAHTDFPQLVIGDDGTIYFVVIGLNNFLCAINHDGSLKWKKWRIEEGYFSNCSLPTNGLDGTIYISTYISTAFIPPGKPIGNSIIAFESNGQFKWSFTEGIKEVRTPLTVDGKGVVYFADAKGIVYAVNSDGRLKWKYHIAQPTDARFSGGAMSVGKNKTIYLKGGFNYLGRQHGFLYAIGEAEQ